MPLIDAQPDALAHIYAKSLFELAQTQGGRARIEEILAELEDIIELARADSAFSEFLASRALGTHDRRDALTRIFRGRVSDLTLNFLLVLNEKNRLGSLLPIASAYDQIVQGKFGRVEVDVTTAEPLSPDALTAMRDRLSRSLGKDVIVHPYVEAAMLGGVKFRIGDQLVDGSFATRLRGMRDQVQNQGGAQLRARIERMFE